MNTQLRDSLPIPDPREVIGLTASFSGLAAMLVLATLAPQPFSQPAPESRVAEYQVESHAVGV